MEEPKTLSPTTYKHEAIGSRDVQALWDENDRLKAIERELNALIESLRASEDRLRLAVEAAHVSISASRHSRVLGARFTCF